LATGWVTCIRFPVGTGTFSFHHHIHTGSEAHLASYPMGTRGTFPGGKAGGGMKLTTQLLLIPRLRMRGAIPQLPYIFMALCLAK